MKTTTRLIGIGHPDRGDDAVGLEVVRRLRARAPAGAEVIESRGDPADLLAAWEGVERVVLVDAARGAGLPGTVRRFEAGERPLPAELRGVSSHALGPSEAVELARELGVLPARVVVYAIEGADFAPGGGLSPAVSAVLPALVEQVLTELSGG